ncbi:uncharacterized protein LOC134844287 [Symsagittifera roscoffensis]|uniref:uncharacterized protein LOC134844287 n=1 Tax=Symsagittifera roscoffensis TaxID=84072 RepID=UPI00307C7BB1
MATAFDYSTDNSSAAAASGIDSGIEIDRNLTSSSPAMSDESSAGKSKQCSFDSGSKSANGNVKKQTSGNNAVLDIKTTAASSGGSSGSGSQHSRGGSRGAAAGGGSNGAAKKNLLPHSLLSIPPKSTAIESQPLVDLENLDSGEEDDGFALPLPVIQHNAMGKKDYRRVQTKEPWSPKEIRFGGGGGGGGFSLTDSGDELDLIPPSVPRSRCSCVSLCPSMFSYSYHKTGQN